MFIKFLDAIDSAIAFIAVLVGWLSLLTLMGARVFEVIARQYITVPSMLLRHYENLAFTLLVVLALGYAYSKNAHVRVDIIRTRLSPRKQAWIEIIGGVLVVLPLAGAIVGLDFDFVYDVYQTGGPWWRRSIMSFGFLLLGLSGLVVISRNVLYLTGRTDRPAPVERN